MADESTKWTEADFAAAHAVGLDREGRSTCGHPFACRIADATRRDNGECQWCNELAVNEEVMKALGECGREWAEKARVAQAQLAVVRAWITERTRFHHTSSTEIVKALAAAMDEAAEKARNA